MKIVWVCRCLDCLKYDDESTHKAIVWWEDGDWWMRWHTWEDMGVYDLTTAILPQIRVWVKYYHRHLE